MHLMERRSLRIVARTDHLGIHTSSRLPRQSYMQPWFKVLTAAYYLYQDNMCSFVHVASAAKWAFSPKKPVETLLSLQCYRLTFPHFS